MMNKIVVAAFLGVFAFSANAQDEHAGHAGDVDSVFENGVIEIETGIPLTNGGFLFESEFGELGNPYGTDEPGFVLDDGSFSVGNVLGFEVQSVLNFWDGISWEATGSDSVSLIDTLNAVTTVSATGIVNPIGIIDEADAEGGVHTHIDFAINDSAATGAYLVEFVLKGFTDATLTNSFTSSDSIFVAFNFGLDEEAYELSVDALGISEVPVPAAWIFLASGLGALVLGRRAKA